MVCASQRTICGSQFSSFTMWRLDLGHQAWWQAPFLTEPFLGSPMQSFREEKVEGGASFTSPRPSFEPGQEPVLYSSTGGGRKSQGQGS